jgi:hypothetical protein
LFDIVERVQDLINDAQKGEKLNEKSLVIKNLTKKNSLVQLRKMAGAEVEKLVAKIDESKIASNLENRCSLSENRGKLCPPRLHRNDPI